MAGVERHVVEELPVVPRRLPGCDVVVVDRPTRALPWSRNRCPTWINVPTGSRRLSPTVQTAHTAHTARVTVSGVTSRSIQLELAVGIGGVYDRAVRSDRDRPAASP